MFLLRVVLCFPSLQRAFHATPVVAKKGDISAAELSSILTEKMSAASDNVSIDEVPPLSFCLSLALRLTPSLCA